MVVVSYHHPSLKGRYSHLKGIELSTIARLRPPENGSEQRDDVLELDQALRRALGLPVELDGTEKVTVAKLHGTGLLFDRIPKIVGRRLVNCRPSALHSEDVEQNVVRLPSEELGLLGIKSGDGVILCGVRKTRDGTYRLKRYHARALEASSDYRTKVENLTAPVDMHKKLAFISKLLYKEEKDRDLSPIFLDKDTRDELFGPPEGQDVRFVLTKGTTDTDTIDSRTRDIFLENIQFAQPVLIYRAPSNAITNEIMSIAFTAAALALAINQAMGARHDAASALLQFFVALIASSALALLVATFKTKNLR